MVSIGQLMHDDASNDLNETDFPARQPYELPQGSATSFEPDPYLAPELPVDMFGIPTPAPSLPEYPRRIPNIGHALLFLGVAFVVMIIGQVLAVSVALATHIFPHQTFYQVYVTMVNDARTSIPMQAFCYGLVVLACIPVFSVIWLKPFGEGVHWNASQAWRRFMVLALIGLAVGFSVTFFGDYLPMPQNPPIKQDMMKSEVGAWLMLVFGVVIAPMLEELAFRGFLLPGLINSFRWFGDRGIIPQPAADRVGIPVSILITSLGFAFMHSQQVSHAWGPLLLIGIVSVVLCIVRLAMNSVAAGVVVHAAYNFTLFAGVLYQTDGFRHLEKLTS
jgi:hypothetical protein